MSHTKKAARSAVIIIILGLISKPLGFVRDVLLSAKFGAKSGVDTYVIATSAIALFAGLFNRTINTTLIPILSEVELKEGKEGKNRHTSNFLNLIILFSFIVMVIAFIFAPQVMKVVAPGFKDEQFELVVLLMRIGIPTLIFNSIQGVLTGYLQTEGKFSETAIGGIIMNFVFIGFLLTLSSKYGIVGLMFTSVVSTILQVIYISMSTSKTTYRHSFHIDIHDEYIGKIIKLIPPILISVGINDLNSIVDKSMGSRLIEGSISALNYAEKLNSLVTGLFVSAITTVMYPIFSEEANKEDRTGLKKATIQSINLILLITVPAALAMMVLATPIVKVVFERGEFDDIATALTAGALIYSAFRMITSSVNTIISNVFYSIQDTKTPLIIGAFGVAVNITLNLILVAPMKHLGLALATTISSFASSILLVYLLRKKIGSMGFMDSVYVGLKTLFASLIMIVIAYFLNNYLLGVLGAGRMIDAIALVITASIGVTIYLGLIYVLKVDELMWFISMFKRKVR